jgi:hypothetical protein
MSRGLGYVYKRLVKRLAVGRERAGVDRIADAASDPSGEHLADLDRHPVEIGEFAGAGERRSLVHDLVAVDLLAP